MGISFILSHRLGSGSHLPTHPRQEAQGHQSMSKQKLKTGIWTPRLKPSHLRAGLLKCLGKKTSLNQH